MIIRDRVKNFVVGEVARLLGRPADAIREGVELVGSGAELESGGLVELMLACEDFVDTEFSARFNWYSDSALSETRSRMRTVGSLIDLVAEKAGADG